jgi:hypothetical protein
VRQLCKALKDDGFNCKPELAVDGGRIDIWAWRGRTTIAIEYDNGVRMKHKSYKKLLSAGCTVALAITRAKPRRRCNAFDLNMKRLQEALGTMEFSNSSNYLYLYLLSLNRLIKLEVPTKNSGHQLTATEIDEKHYWYCSL